MAPSSGNGTYDWVSIGDLCECRNGRAFKPTDWGRKEGGGLPIVRIQNLNDESAEMNYFAGEVSEKFLIEQGDLLFSWSGSRGTSFGPHLWQRGRAILNQHIFRLDHSDRVDRRYLYWALKRLTEDVERNLHGGVGLVHITKPKFEALMLPLPPLDEQRAIVAEIEGYQNRIAELRLEKQRLQQQISARIAAVWGEAPTPAIIVAETPALADAAA